MWKILLHILLALIIADDTSVVSFIVIASEESVFSL